MKVTLGVFGEYDDYVLVNVNKSEFKGIEKLIKELECSNANVSIRVIKIEE